MEEKEVWSFTRRHLPHLEVSGSTYFVTYRTRSGIFLKCDERLIVLNRWKEGNEKYCSLFAAVIMPDHVHAVFQPIAGYRISQIMKGMKAASARDINKSRNSPGSIWQEESFDRIVRSSKELTQVVEYMLNNPVRAGFAENPENYCGWYYNPNALW